MEGQDEKPLILILIINSETVWNWFLSHSSSVFHNQSWICSRAATNEYFHSSVNQYANLKVYKMSQK